MNKSPQSDSLVFVLSSESLWVFSRVVPSAKCVKHRLHSKPLCVCAETRSLNLCEFAEGKSAIDIIPVGWKNSAQWIYLKYVFFSDQSLFILFTCKCTLYMTIDAEIDENFGNKMLRISWLRLRFSFSFCVLMEDKYQEHHPRCI